MIVVAAALVAPLLGYAGWISQSWSGLGVVGLLVVLVLAVDAWFGLAIARDGSVTLEGDVRATQHDEFEVSAIASLDGRSARMNIGVDWPEDCETENRIQSVALDGDPAEISWNLLPTRRGEINIDAVHFEVSSPLGLWAWRRHLPAAMRVRVYPSLLQDRGVLAPLFLRRAATGLHVVRQVGKGREFEQLREYVPGDSYEDIYWKATARRGKPVTKIHQIERTQDVYIVVDASRRSMRRLTEVEAPGEHRPTQLDRFVRAAMALSLTALQQGDRPGLGVFGPGLRSFLRAGGGQQQYSAIRDQLYDLQGRSEPPDFADMFADLGNRIRQRALLLFLTDLDDPVLADQFCEEIQAFSRRHVVLVGQLQAPGIAPVFDKSVGEVENDNDVYGRLAGQLLWDGAQQTGTRLKSQGVHWVSSSSEELVSEMVSTYLNIKRRQLL